jgi:hypothetical protein
MYSTFKGTSQSVEDWRSASSKLKELESSISQGAAKLERLISRIRTLEAQDGGLLRDLRDEPAELARVRIRQFVASRMQAALWLARVSLWLVGVVLGARLLDWILYPRLPVT